jgi:hypothetical protein
MDHSLKVIKESDGKYTATIEGPGDDGIVCSARSPGNSTPRDAIAGAARIFSTRNPLFGTNIQSVEDLK